MKLVFHLLLPFIALLLLYSVILYFTIKKRKTLYTAEKLVWIIVPALLGMSIYYIYSTYFLDEWFIQRFTDYTAILAHEIYYSIMICGFLVLSLLLGISTILICLNKVLQKRYIIIFTLFIVGGISLTILEGMKPYLDIKQNSYITYTGRFRYIGDMMGSDSITLLEDNKKKLISNLYEELQTGDYTGCVVYGKHSKRVVKLTVSQLGQSRDG